MAVNVVVNVEFDSNTREFTFSGGNTPANDGTVDFQPGSGNTVTYQPKENQGIWFLTDVSWDPVGVLGWEWLNDVANGSIVVFDKDVPVNEPVEYSVMLDIEEVANMQASSGGPVIINKPEDGMAGKNEKRMSSSG